MQEGLQQTISHQKVEKDTNLEMTTTNDTYPISTNRYSISITNNGMNSIQFGTDFNLQIYKNKKWYDIPFKDNTGFTAIGLIVEPGKSFSDSFSFELSDFTLEPAQYRIIKYFYDESYAEKFPLAAEFTIIRD